MRGVSRALAVRHVIPDGNFYTVSERVRRWTRTNLWSGVSAATNKGYHKREHKADEDSDRRLRERRHSNCRASGRCRARTRTRTAALASVLAQSIRIPNTQSPTSSESLYGPESCLDSCSALSFQYFLEGIGSMKSGSKSTVNRFLRFAARPPIRLPGEQNPRFSPSPGQMLGTAPNHIILGICLFIDPYLRRPRLDNQDRIPYTCTTYPDCQLNPHEPFRLFWYKKKNRMIISTMGNKDKKQRQRKREQRKAADLARNNNQGLDTGAQTSRGSPSSLPALPPEDRSPRADDRDPLRQSRAPASSPLPPLTPSLQERSRIAEPSPIRSCDHARSGSSAERASVDAQLSLTADVLRRGRPSAISKNWCKATIRDETDDDGMTDEQSNTGREQGSTKIGELPSSSPYPGDGESVMGDCERSQRRAEKQRRTRAESIKSAELREALRCSLPTESAQSGSEAAHRPHVWTVKHCVCNRV
ncbi:hypothetical protein DFH09DRAFT_1067494 [Mycena vulgaris]|nr:hypothetical protein DFH09DRAFT_1067494 [Mycena vulgaris]